MALAGKVIVVTGATGVIGSTLCAGFLQQGARVALLGHRLDRARALHAELAAKDLGPALALEADVLDRASLERALAAVLDGFGRVDVLVNGAGGNHPDGTAKAEQLGAGAPLEEGFFGLDPAAFEAVGRLNFLGTVLPSQVFGRAMVPGGGCILNLSSVAATLPLSRVGAYAAAKASVENFTRWLAHHLAPMGIRVNAVAPGFLLTQQNRFLLLEADGETLTARGRKVIGHTPMGRFGRPEELLGAVSFLCSEEAAFITGVVLPVDGGFLATPGL